MNIGIIGKLGSGKTSVADYLVKNYKFNRVSLATPIKEIMKEYFNIKDKTDSRYRRLAQKIGTDWFRSEDNDVWINYMIKTINKINDMKRSQNYDNDLNFVCDDCRFINEVEKLINNQWLMIYLDCPEKIRIKRCQERDNTFNLETLNHPSETQVDEVVKKFGDCIIKLDSSVQLNELYQNVDLILREVI